MGGPHHDHTHSSMDGARPSVGAGRSALDADPVLKTLGLEVEDPEEIFEIHSREGAGAFGRVFRGSYKKEPTKLAAIKVIPVALHAGQRGEDIENVRKEIQFLRECDHPNVVGFYGAYYKDGALWVVMEYCGGGSVSDIGRLRRFEESEIAVILREALQGLMYLHSKKKIHRDIKGGNILLTTSGQVKIADFGVSAQLRDTMSRRGTFVGTPYWMSPEMIQDSDYDYKSDIWSLGITAIELADQKPPLFDEHPMRVLIQIPRNPPPQLKNPSEWSPAFSAFLQFCLAKDPKERPNACDCLHHPFITGVHEIKHVFAQGGTDAVPYIASSCDAPVVLAAPPPPHCGPEEKSAEHQGDADAAMDKIASTNSSEPEENSTNVEEEIEEEIHVVLDDETPPLQDADPDLLEEPGVSQGEQLPDSQLLSTSDSSSISGDIKNRSVIMNELLDLSVDESFELPASNNSSNGERAVQGDNEPKEREETSSRGYQGNGSHGHSETILKSHEQWSNPLVDIETSHSHNEFIHEQTTPAFRYAGSPLAGQVSTRSSGSAASSANFIGGPYGVSHEVCVRFNSIDARYEGAPECAEWASIHQQFGIPIQQMRCRSFENDRVPALLHMLRRELLIRDGVHCKYVYRINPEQREIQTAKQAINTGVFESNKVVDPHVFASLIKHWFRDLPVPLLSKVELKEFDIMNQLVKEKNDGTLQLLNSADELNTKSTRFVGLIGIQERSVLEWLLDHLLEVSRKSKCNMMTRHALSIVMAPNLYRVATSSAEQATSISTRIAMTLRVLLLWRDHLGKEPLSPVKRSDIGVWSDTGASERSSKASSRELRERGCSTLASSSSSAAASSNSAQKSNSSRRRLMLLSSMEAFATKSECYGTKSKAVDAKLSKSFGLQRSNSDQEVDKVSSPPDSNNNNADHDPEQSGASCSLYATLQQYVDKLHDTIAQEGLRLEDLQADKGLEQKLFSQFQSQVWSCVRRLARAKDERKWAEDAAKAVHDSIESNCTGLFRRLPPTLTPMRKWLLAATRIDEFEILLKEQQTISDKLDALEQKYSFLTRNVPVVEDLEPATMAGEIIGCRSFADLLRWNASRQQRQDGSLSTINQKEDPAAATALPGASRLLRASLAVVDERRVHQMVKTAHSEPVLGNLLAALSLSDDQVPPHLKEQRDQLLALTSSAYKTYSDFDSV